MEVRGEPTQTLFRHFEVCWWNFNCWCLLSALGTLRSPSSSGSEGRTAPSHTESGTSQGSLARGKQLPEDMTVHTQLAATWVFSQDPLPALEMEEETMLSRKRNFSGPALSRTPAHSPPSDHPGCECSYPSLTR